LIDIAGERGLQANLVRLDWEGLQAAVETDPLLVLLKNANVVAVMTNGFHGPDEIVVSDPLNRDGELLYLPRSELESGWDGDALIVAPQPIKRQRSFFWMITLLCVGATLSAAVFFLAREVRVQVATSEPPAGETSAVTARDANQLQTPNVRSDAGTPVPVGAKEEKSSERAAPGPTAAPANVPTVATKVEPKAEVKAPVATPPAAPRPLADAPAIAAKAEPKAEAKEPVATPAPATPAPPSATRAPVATGAIRSSPPEPAMATEAPPPQPTPAPTAVAKTSPPAVSPVPPAADTGPAAAARPLAAPTPAGREVTAPLPSTPAPNPPQVASIETVSREPPKLSTTQIDALVARGDFLIGVADVVSARLFYERAAEAGNGPAALRLGETYDPQFLERARLGRVPGDPAMAAHWYNRARELGVSAAEILLNSAESK
jgi:hypothetical protein